MQAIVVERVVEASAADVWEIIRRGDGLEKRFPPVDVQSRLPRRNLLGSMFLSADVAPSSGAAAARCRVLWMLNGDLTDPAAHEVVRVSVAQLYLSGIDGLEAAARSRSGTGGGL